MSKNNASGILVFLFIKTTYLIARKMNAYNRCEHGTNKLKSNVNGNIINI